MFYPIYQEISYQNAEDVFAHVAQDNGAILLDSSQLMPGCGRYSYVVADPFLTILSKNGLVSLNHEKINGNPWEILKTQLKKFSLQTHIGLPPFQGGIAGFFAYDLYQHLEEIHSAQLDDMQFPDMAVGFYDVVMAFDHELKKAWIFSSGLPCVNEEERKRRAVEKLNSVVSRINGGHASLCPPCVEWVKRSVPTIESNFTPAQYCSAVQKVKDYILAGDIFEANISQRFQAKLPENVTGFELYSALRKRNSAPFSAYLSFDNTVIASASPERFLKLTNGQVETRPIKGTRPRGKSSEEDQQFAQDLMTSEKDHAENVMIVDLLRNDLSRVCEPHSVKVPQLCGLESYATVHHLVSVVTGKLRAQFDAVDLLCATFPGGSITGAPKIRSMEIIAEIEPTKRGPYCGSIGYIGFDGNMDTSIVIRTYAIKNNIVNFQAGGAVTMDSDPLTEYEETLTKAKALREVLYDFAN